MAKRSAFYCARTNHARTSELRHTHLTCIKGALQSLDSPAAFLRSKSSWISQKLYLSKEIIGRPTLEIGVHSQFQQRDALGSVNVNWGYGPLLHCDCVCSDYTKTIVGRYTGTLQRTSCPRQEVSSKQATSTPGKTKKAVHLKILCPAFLIISICE